MELDGCMIVTCNMGQAGGMGLYNFTYIYKYIYIFICNVLICSSDSALFGFVWNLLVSRVVSSDCRTKTHFEATLEHYFLSIWERRGSVCESQGVSFKGPAKSA